MGLNDLDDSREGISKYLKRNPNTCFVAEYNSEIIGVIIFGYDGRRGIIYNKGNTFWQKQGFEVRDDLIYRNKSLSYIKRIDT